MSRFDFDDYSDGPSVTWEMQQWNLKRHLASAKGQAKLREFRDALLAMPERRLIDSDLSSHGDVCAIGAFAAYKRVQQGAEWPAAVQALHDQYQPTQHWPTFGIDQDRPIDAIETADVAVRECGLNRTLAWELAYRNDETLAGWPPETRWQRMYDWACKLIRDEAAA